MSVTVVRVATLNTQLLTLPGVLIQEGPAYSPQDYEAKIGFIGALIERGQVDLIGFQEVYHQAALEAAVARAPRFAGATVVAPLADGKGPKTAGGALTAPRVGLASRLPIRSVESIRRFPAELGNGLAVRREQDGRQHVVPVCIDFFERPVLRPEVEFPGGMPVVVYVAHFKSRRPVILDDEDRFDPAARTRAVVRSLVQRAAEAAALRILLTRELSGAAGGRKPVLVLGDLNDELNSVTTDLVRGDKPLPDSLKTLMDDPQDWQRKNRRLWEQHLYSAAEIQAGHMTGAALYSHIHFGDYQVLDHILFSKEFDPSNPERAGALRYVQVYNDHVLDTHMTDMGRGDRSRSDHGMPVAEIAFDIDRRRGPGRT